MLYFPKDYATIELNIYGVKIKMRKTLQIVFCILACLCVVAAFLLGAFFGLIYFLCAIAGAVVFAVLMTVVKNGSVRASEPPKTDFMNTDAQNEEIRKAAKRDDGNGSNDGNDEQTK